MQNFRKKVRRRDGLRTALGGLVLVAGTHMAAAEDPITIEQKAKTNFAVIVSGNKNSSNLKIKQSGRINEISSKQSAQQNSVASLQSGWQNAIVINQEGWIDAASVTQSGPGHGPGPVNLPTTYKTENTDDGYLSYFASGGFSIVTLTDPAHTISSRFGRYR